MPRQNKLQIACIGEAMVELSINQQSDIALGYAGDTLNTAIYLKRLLGEDAELAYCTVLGKDSLSSRLVQYIQSESISTDFIRYSNHKTVGLYAIDTDEFGERSFSYWRSDSAARTLFQSGESTDFSSLDNFDVLYLSAITLAIIPELVRTSLREHLTGLQKNKSVRVVFDSNYRPALWESVDTAQTAVADFWKIADIALPSIDDEQALFKDKDEDAVFGRLKHYGIKQGALKRGASGPLSLTPGFNDKVHYPAVETVVDSTAAGDSFNAGYLSAALTGGTDADALLAGHHCASRVIGCRGAIIPKQDW